MKDKIQTFKNFIVSDCNSEAYNICSSFVQNPFGRFIALCGSTATGKTHLMSAICNAYTANFPNLKVKTAMYEDIMSDYIELLRRKANESEYEEFYKNEFDYDLLLIDNMQFIAGKEYTQEVFAEWFLRMLKERKSVVIAFDRPTQYYDKLLKPLASKSVVLTLNEADSKFKNKYLCDLLADANFELPSVIKNTLVYDPRIPYYSFYGYLSKVKVAQELLGRRLTEKEFFESLKVYRHTED